MMPELKAENPHNIFDKILDASTCLTPIFKQAVRGAYTEVNFKYYYYLQQCNPNTDVIGDVYINIIKEMCALKEADVDKLAKLVRAFNSKVPEVYSIKKSVVIEVYTQLVNCQNKPTGIVK